MQIPALSSALEGMSRAETQFNRAAGDIDKSSKQNNIQTHSNNKTNLPTITVELIVFSKKNANSWLGYACVNNSL